MTDRRFGTLGLLLLIAAAQPSQPAADRAGNRIETLRPQRQAAPAAEGERLPVTYCKRIGDWCATLRREGEGEPWELLVFAGGVRGGGEPRRYPLPEAAEDETEVALWPCLVREADGALLVGIKWYRRTMYSGGGAGVERLQLLRLTDDATPVLEAPIEASAMVRACFSDDDMRQRAGACHDEYEFSGSLTLDPTAAAGWPRFILTTVARTYPGQVSRYEDSAERAQLRRRDLVWWRDPTCSYTHRFVPDAAGHYAPDTPLPACSDYLDI